MPLNDECSYAPRLDGHVVRSSMLDGSPPSRLALAREIGRLESEANAALRSATKARNEVSLLELERTRVLTRLQGDNPDRYPARDQAYSEAEGKAKEVFDSLRASRKECEFLARRRDEVMAEREAAQRRCEELEKNLAASQLNAQVYLAALHRGATLHWSPDAKQFCASDRGCIFTADDLTVACEKFVAAKKEDEPHGA